MRGANANAVMLVRHKERAAAFQCHFKLALFIMVVCLSPLLVLGVTLTFGLAGDERMEGGRRQ